MTFRKLLVIPTVGLAGCTVLSIEDTFTGADGLVTNEFAHWNAPAGQQSLVWDMTSGSLFRRNGVGWSGTIDAGVAPNATSSNATNSAVFRLTTHADEFTTFEVSFRLKLIGFTSTASTPAQAWDGIHVFCRYADEAELYYASVARRDGKVVVKKKTPGGPSNGGTYHDLTAYPSAPMSVGAWHDVKVTVGGTDPTTITMIVDGVTLLTAQDTGQFGAPIAMGATGIRGDNVEFEIDDFKVRVP